MASVERPIRLKHLHVVRPFKRGGFGAVYAAWDRKLERDVAVKALRHDLFPTRLVLERCGNNKRQACQELGISYHTLRSYLRFQPRKRPAGGGRPRGHDR